MSIYFMQGFGFNQIANDYHLKRKKPWKPLELFLNYLKDKGYSLIGESLDLGCANGRNFNILGTFPKKLVGLDISPDLVKIAFENLRNSSLYSTIESKFIQIVLSDIKNLPIRPNSFKNIFSIATIHHIKNKADRKRCINQMYNILQNNGLLIFTVWRKWQKKYRGYFILDWIKRNISNKYKKLQYTENLNEFGDKYIPWRLSSENKVFYRFYHFFSKKEIKKLLKNFEIKELKLMGGPENRDNFFILAKKEDQ